MKYIYIAKMTEIHYPEIEGWTYDENMFRDYINEINMIYQFFQLECFVERIENGSDLGRILTDYGLELMQELYYSYSLDKTVCICFNKKFILDWVEKKYETKLGSVCKGMANKLLLDSIGSIIKLIRIVSALSADPELKDSIMALAYTMVSYGLQAGKYSTRYDKRVRNEEDNNNAPSTDVIDDIKLLALVNDLM